MPTDEIEPQNNSQSPHTNDQASNDQLTTELPRGEFELKLDELQKRCDDTWDKLIRTTAEFDNYKKRSQKELETVRKFAVEDFASELVTIYDSLIAGNALCESNKESLPNQFIEGYNMTLSLTQQLMQRIKIEEVNPINQKFDPSFHQAMGVCSDDDIEVGFVGQVLQKGYTLQGRLLRPALVTVKK
ncbi:MAG: nucleotide exchange factor GrpE [Methylacidiphilales bacterium]|nr:nucleotide exchange factor GrpE [Candidatus Methylacidiphilales bacterium]